MEFEKEVLGKVVAVLQQERKACFFNGSLFVECDEYQAREIWHKLTKFQGLGRVQIAKMGPEYVYDFVA
jgi:hypothetical protein